MKTLALLFLYFVLSQSYKESFSKGGQSYCTSDNECEVASHPFCAILQVDQNSNPEPKIEGVCVSCRDDCDCPVNMQCGADLQLGEKAFKISSYTDKNENHFFQSKGMGNMYIASKCFNQGKSNTEMNGMGLGPERESMLGAECRTDEENDVQQKPNSGEGCSNKNQTGWTKADFDEPVGTSFCGSLSQNQRFLGAGEWKGGQPRVAINGNTKPQNTDKVSCDMQNKAAVCFPYVDGKDENLLKGRCLTSLTYNFSATADTDLILSRSGKIRLDSQSQHTPGKFELGIMQTDSVVAPLQDWVGQCTGALGKGGALGTGGVKSTCQICQEGALKCGGGGGQDSRGTTQICHKGKWVAHNGQITALNTTTQSCTPYNNVLSPTCNIIVHKQQNAKSWTYIDGTLVHASTFNQMMAAIVGLSIVVAIMMFVKILM